MTTQPPTQSIHTVTSQLDFHDFIHQLSHLGNVNYHDPELFETIGNHSHVRSLVLSDSQTTANSTYGRVIRPKRSGNVHQGQLTELTVNEVYLSGCTGNS